MGFRSFIAEIARWARDKINFRRIVPTLDGQYVFEVSRSAFRKFTEGKKITQYTRSILKKQYGIILRTHRRTIEFIVKD